MSKIVKTDEMEINALRHERDLLAEELKNAYLFINNLSVSYQQFATYYKAIKGTT